MSTRIETSARLARSCLLAAVTAVACTCEGCPSREEKPADEPEKLMAAQRINSVEFTNSPRKGEYAHAKIDYSLDEETAEITISPAGLVSPEKFTVRRGKSPHVQRLETLREGTHHITFTLGGTHDTAKLVVQP